MINRLEYELLDRIKKNKVIYARKCISQMRSLIAEGFIGLSNPTLQNLDEYIYHSCFITEKGKRAYEEYRNAMWKIKKENISLLISFAAIIISIIALVLKTS